MPYILIPGIKAPNMGTIFILDVLFRTLHLPDLQATGLGDVALADVAVYAFSWGGFGLGPAAFLPSATAPELGRGKLQIGPVFAVGVSRVPHLVLTLAVTNFFSVAGAGDRPDVNALWVNPIIGYALPKAFFLRFDPIWIFDWKRDGHATIPVNLAAGYAFTAHLALQIQPDWVTTGDLKNSVGVQLIISYLGW
jgi:hypothetical protein